MTEDINVTFIIPKGVRDENDCSEDMKLAFTSCEQHSGSGLNTKWVHETKWKKFTGLTKKDVIVLSEFEGELFESLKGSKCLLVGPRCLSCCLTEGTSIPSGPEPVYTIAMRGLVVTASGLSKQQKNEIKNKVQWMGGVYSTVMAEDTTHLISNTVLSDKYIKSVEKGVPVMSESWVDAAWAASLQRNINASSSDFDDHKLPPFANLQITTSGITKREKQNIMKLVNENGGVFSGPFQSETTDIVVLTKEGVGSEKYKAALEYGKACVTPEWVVESASRGHALPLARYRVAGATTSSPLAEHRVPDMSLNFSRITNVRPPVNFVDETRSADMSVVSARMKLSQDSKRGSDRSSMEREVVSELEKFDMSVLKRAGPIFDGFCIWVTGLDGVARERASALVSRGGGVRYECAHDRVTHAVAGTRAAALAARRALPGVPVLSPLWLVRSAVSARAVDETEFLIETDPTTPAKKARQPRIEPASPMSKRNLQLLRRVPLDLPPPTPEEPEPPVHDEILHHYLSQNVPEPEQKTPEPQQDEQHPDITEDVEEDPTEEIEQIFRGIKIEVVGLDEDAICEIGAEVSAAGGVLVGAGAGGEGGYALTPLDYDAEALEKRGLEPVTVFWIKDCLSQEELLPIQYYHRPVKLPQWEDEGPLKGVVASLSTYSGVERAFLDELAKLLGATTQLRFCRRNTANALASTHLICPTPVGDKYLGALKWGLPAVKASWLLECSRIGRRVSEKGHLVGETKAPPTPEPQPEPAIQEDIAPDITEDRSKSIDNEMEKHNEMEKEKEMERDKENAMLPPAFTMRRGSAPTAEHTPKSKVPDEDMSPASRYIAMARQGLLGSDSQETPKRLQELKEDARLGEPVRTPPLDDALSTPNIAALSPTTRRRLQAIKRGELPSDPIRTPTDPFERAPATPDSAFGAALRPGAGRLSPDSRKRLWTVVDRLPHKQPLPMRENTTPLSEIRNRFLAQFNSDADTPPSEHHAGPRKLHLQDQVETPPAKRSKLSDDLITPRSANTTEASTSTKSVPSSSSTLPAALDAQLQRLSAALSAPRLSGPRPRRATRDCTPPPVLSPESEPIMTESQPNTVGWDDNHVEHQTRSCEEVKKFMLSSNVDNRDEIMEMIRHLGGVVSDGAELDATATHFLCSAPGRSEKMLGSMAAGKWVLHPAYVARSRAHGAFLPEEEYEWGNPRAVCLPALSGAERSLAAAAYRWREARARRRPGPFDSLVALLHVPAARKALLARLLHAGGGEAVDDTPPYSNDRITVCFADIKRYPLSERDSAWLVSKRIPVCAPVLLSSFLTEETRPDPEQHCLPEFRPK